MKNGINDICMSIRLKRDISHDFPRKNINIWAVQVNKHCA